MDTTRWAAGTPTGVGSMPGEDPAEAVRVVLGELPDLPHRHHPTAIAVGISGSGISFDGGRSWRQFDTGSFDTISCARSGACSGACWASGEAGRVAVLSHRRG
ncbi:MAG: hypothetical protein QOE53_2463 [Pseudonocardiales bacterium]|jgi:hypothetical protein|nr:hypothetical protein [Pseudonocardiales bacterium]